MASRIGTVLSSSSQLEIDLGELGLLSIDDHVVSFKPEAPGYNMTKSTGKLSVRRLFEMKELKTNMNFYKMGDNVKSEEGLKKSASKLDMFRNVSKRLKTLSKSSSLATMDSTAFYKAGSDPLSTTQSCSQLVDTPRDLLMMQIPKPKPTEFPLVPLIENCAETLCVPVSNKVGFTTPSQRIASN